MRSIFRVVVFLLLVCIGGPLLAQSASVSGNVVDTQGAAVKGADVDLTNTDTGVRLKTVSRSDGNFILPPVVPGHYQMKVMASGFRPWTDTGITVEIGEIKTVKAVLPVGAVSDAITVTDAPPELQVENADRSTLLEPMQVTNLPLDPRNPLQLIAATVGVTLQRRSHVRARTTPTESTTNQFRINGSKYATTDMLIDGGANMVAYNSQVAGIPGVDATSEFRVLTTAYAPECTEHTSGGIVNMSIKPGTVKCHAWRWMGITFRNQVMDANGYNANNAGQARPGICCSNQFGGQVRRTHCDSTSSLRWP